MLCGANKSAKERPYLLKKFDQEYKGEKEREGDFIATDPFYSFIPILSKQINLRAN